MVSSELWMKRTPLVRRSYLNRRTPLRAVSKTNSRRLRYARHLASSYWRTLKARIFRRDDYTCQECGEPATDLAHLTYATFGKEMDEDVRAECSICNQAERVRRLLS